MPAPAVHWVHWGVIWCKDSTDTARSEGAYRVWRLGCIQNTVIFFFSKLGFIFNFLVSPIQVSEYYSLTLCRPESPARIACEKKRALKSDKDNFDHHKNPEMMSLTYQAVHFQLETLC